MADTGKAVADAIPFTDPGFVQVKTAGGAGANPAAIWNSATQVGSYLMALLISESAPSATPAGWTLLRTSGTFRWYAIENSGSRSGAETWTAVANDWGLILVEFSGIEASGAEELYALGSGQTSASTRFATAWADGGDIQIGKGVAVFVVPEGVASPSTGALLSSVPPPGWTLLGLNIGSASGGSAGVRISAWYRILDRPIDRAVAAIAGTSTTSQSTPTGHIAVLRAATGGLRNTTRTLIAALAGGKKAAVRSVRIQNRLYGIAKVTLSAGARVVLDRHPIAPGRLLDLDDLIVVDTGETLTWKIDQGDTGIECDYVEADA